MFLIVGLGNPGEEYEHTRHNAGFDAVDLIAEEVGARYWKTECGALTAKACIAITTWCWQAAKLHEHVGRPGEAADERVRRGC
ncbi:MAG: hypothetical protein ACLSVD_03635 [Eggerthellaceae bacterium]